MRSRFRSLLGQLADLKSSLLRAGSNYFGHWLSDFLVQFDLGGHQVVYKLGIRSGCHERLDWWPFGTISWNSEQHLAVTNLRTNAGWCKIGVIRHV